MSKILSVLMLSTFAFSAQAASHAGGAPMAAVTPAMAASAAKVKAKVEAAEPGVAASAAKVKAKIKAKKAEAAASAGK